MSTPLWNLAYPAPCAYNPKMSRLNARARTHTHMHMHTHTHTHSLSLSLTHTLSPFQPAGRGFCRRRAPHPQPRSHRQQTQACKQLQANWARCVSLPEYQAQFRSAGSTLRSRLWCWMPETPHRVRTASKAQAYSSAFCMSSRTCVGGHTDSAACMTGGWYDVQQLTQTDERVERLLRMHELDTDLLSSASDTLE